MSTPSSPFCSPYSFVSLCRPLQPMLLLSLFRYCPFRPTDPPINSAKYLGAYISANRSSDAGCDCRYSQASGAFRSLFPVFTNPALQIYSQTVMAILFYGCESKVYTPAQITRLNALHYKVLRQVFQVKSSFYHRVLQPSDAECSNAFLLQLAYVHAPRLLIPSQRISVQRLYDT